MGILETGDTPFHIWVPSNIEDSELDELLDMCGEVHKKLLFIRNSKIPIWEGMELLEQTVPDIDDYLDYIESQI